MNYSAMSKEHIKISKEKKKNDLKAESERNGKII